MIARAHELCGRRTYRAAGAEALPVAETSPRSPIEFLEWTPENRLRHPKFVALRDHREAEEVVCEE